MSQYKNKALYLQHLHIELSLFMYTGALRLIRVRTTEWLSKGGLQSRDAFVHVRHKTQYKNKNNFFLDVL